MTYSDLMAVAPGEPCRFTKLAQLDVQEAQLEQDFSKLAYMFVADKAAQMMRYLLGFEVVENEPDGSKAVGVFGFKVGKDYYYIPAFFITNQVKGVDMVFSKRTNMFVPLTEEWVDDIVQRDSIELGDAASAGSTMQDFERPDFDFVRSPNVGASFASKTAESDGYVEEEPGKSLMKSAWDAMCRTTIEKLSNDKDMQDALSGFVGRLSGKKLSKKAEHGVLEQWLSERGGPSAVKSLFNGLCSSVKFANAALSVYPDIEALCVSRFRPTAHGCTKRAERELRIVSSRGKDTGDKDTERLLVNGFYIDDRRDTGSLSSIFDYDHTESFSKPESTGKYDILMSDGTTQPTWVVESIACNGHDRRRYVLTDPVGSKKLRGCRSAEKTCYAKGGAVADIGGLYDTAIPLSEMEEGATYMLVDRSGKNVIPSFTVGSCRYTPGENIKVDGYSSCACDDVCCGDNGSGTWDDVYNRYRDRAGHLRSSSSSYIDGITLTGNTGKAMQAGSRILVPSNYKAVLTDVPYDERGGESAPSIRPGNLSDLRFNMKQASFHTIKVLSDGPEYYVRVDDLKLSRPMSYKQACMSLTGRMGMSVSDTESILSKAAESHEASTHIHFGKAAQFVGVGMPTPPPQTPSIDPYSGVPVYGPYETETQGGLVGAPQYPHGNPYGENLGGEGETQQAMGGEPLPIDQEAVDLASQAGQLGQRHVFDYAAIGGLAKVYDTGSLIDSYIPQFMQSIDRLGRILFLYYWKNEDFGERYGTSDTVALEDTLRSVFKQFGNLALVLRQKTIDVDGAGD